MYDPSVDGPPATSQSEKKLDVHLRMKAEIFCSYKPSIIEGKELGIEKAASQFCTGIVVRATCARPYGVGTCLNRQPDKNRVPQAEGDMTLLTWLGLKPEGSLTAARGIGSACRAAPPGNPQPSVSARERMEPIPPG